MPIKVRLVLSYIAMLVIPTVLIFLAAIIIFASQISQVAKSGNLTSGMIRDIVQSTPQIYMEVKNAMTGNPEKLEDKTYLNQLENRMSILNAGFAVKKDGKFIYVSAQAENSGIIDRLDSCTREDISSSKPIIIGGVPYNVIPNQFKFNDGIPGEFFYIINMSNINSFAKKYFTSLFYVILVIIILTNGVITYLVSRSILRPLNVLKRGTEEIKQGNLEFAVKCPSKDEIGEVCGAFEEMRLKLKDSIELQLQVEENRKELVSNISHDLKTPITSIKGYVEGIMDGVADTPEKMDRYIRTVYAKAVDMDRLIDDLFLFSKLDLKSLPFNFERTDIVKYFKDCSDELRLDFESRDITFSLETDLQSAVVAADREKLKRVVLNIIDNSAKYMDRPDGSIIIRLRDAGEAVEAEIRDNGRGIDSEELPYIFDRFYRADPSRNTATGGSGLGLAIARQIIEGHGGTIRAESEPGKGTGIYFTLRKFEESKTEAAENL